MMYLKSVDDENKYVKIDATNKNDIKLYYHSNRREVYYMSILVDIDVIWDMSIDGMCKYIEDQLRHMIYTKHIECSIYTIGPPYISKVSVTLYRYETEDEFLDRMYTIYKSKEKKQRRRIQCNGKAKYLHSV